MNDVAFVNNIESFYKDRRMIQELMKTGGDFYIWVKPTSKEEAIHVIQSDILSGSKDNFISYMEKRLKEERVKNSSICRRRSMSLIASLIDQFFVSIS